MIFRLVVLVATSTSCHEVDKAFGVHVRVPGDGAIVTDRPAPGRVVLVPREIDIDIVLQHQVLKGFLQNPHGPRVRVNRPMATNKDPRSNFTVRIGFFQVFFQPLQKFTRPPKTSRWEHAGVPVVLLGCPREIGFRVDGYVVCQPQVEGVPHVCVAAAVLRWHGL